MLTWFLYRYLPAALIAAFIKRMARLSLTAPPAASVIIIPFIYNLLKRHPTCMSLIHSNKAVDDATDPFSMDNLNPYECKAIESSLWEVQTLSQHYYANVSTLAKIFSEQFLKPKYNLEDFLDHTYGTVSVYLCAPLLSCINLWCISSLLLKLIARERRNQHWQLINLQHVFGKSRSSFCFIYL